MIIIFVDNNYCRCHSWWTKGPLWYSLTKLSDLSYPELYHFYLSYLKKFKIPNSLRFHSLYCTGYILTMMNLIPISIVLFLSTSCIQLKYGFRSSYMSDSNNVYESLLLEIHVPQIESYNIL